jgi:hypothetical protein
MKGGGNMLKDNLKIGQYIQQGDVIVEKVNEVKGKKLDHCVLAKGEVTGHCHSICDGKAELYDDNGTLYLKVNKTSTLTHQEHHPVKIKKGNYIVRKVREYDHFLEESRPVQD